MKFLRVTRLEKRAVINQFEEAPVEVESTGGEIAIPVSAIVGVEQANYSGAWRAEIHVYDGTTFTTCDYYDEVMRKLENL